MQEVLAGVRLIVRLLSDALAFETEDAKLIAKKKREFAELIQLLHMNPLVLSAASLALIKDSHIASRADEYSEEVVIAAVVRLRKPMHVLNPSTKARPQSLLTNAPPPRRKFEWLRHNRWP